MYSSRSNDVWSLGVLLINFACGRNPWVRAHPEEETFAAFMRDPDYLLSILPISIELNNLLKRVFLLDPSQRIGLDELIDGVARIERFTLNYNELCRAPDVVRNAAGPLLRVRQKQERILRALAAQAQGVFEDAAAFGVQESSTVDADWQSLMEDSLGSLLGTSDGSEEACYVSDDDECYAADTEEWIVDDDYEPTSFDDHDVSSHHRQRTVSDPGQRPSLSYASSGQPRSPSIGPEDVARFSISSSNLYQHDALGSPFEESGHWSPTLSDPASLPSTPGGPMTPGDLAFVPPDPAAADKYFASTSGAVEGLALGLYNADFASLHKSSEVRLFRDTSPEAFPSIQDHS